MSVIYKGLYSHILQIYLISIINPKNILEIGIGKGFVSHFLKQFYNLITIDFNKELNPDILMDITDLKELNSIKDKSFDVIILCQVLEHIPYEIVENVLKILKKKTRKYIILSVPNQTIYLNLTLFSNSSRLIFKKFKNSFNNFFKKISKSLSKLDYRFRKKNKRHIYKITSRYHQWCLGIDKYDTEIFKKLLRKYFKIIREIRVKEHPYHHFFFMKI